MDVRKILESAQGSVRNTYDSGVEGLLDRLGLEQQRSTMEIVLPSLAIFGAGLAVGAALGIMFAPKRGDELRTDLKHRIGDLKDRGVERYETLVARGEELLEEEKTNGAASEA